jgi:hypothetical protein
MDPDSYVYWKCQDNATTSKYLLACLVCEYTKCNVLLVRTLVGFGDSLCIFSGA